MSWHALEEEIARWRAAGHVADFWWRDDDAGKSNPALERLLALARSSGVPLALAVVPADAEARVLAGLDARVSVLQHGTDHVNRAAAGAKKSEFPDSEPAGAALKRLGESREQLRRQAGERFVPVLAPPWNRLRRELVSGLAKAGYAGLSQYGAREKAEPVAGLRQVNTHADIIAWHAGRGFVGEEAALAMIERHLAARRAGAVDAAEPTGLLTHHACHDDAAWRFLERLFAFTRDSGARWHAAAELFR